MLNIFVAEVGLQRPGIMPPVCKRVTARVAQHVRVHAELELGHKTDHADLRLYDALRRLRTFRGYLPVRHHAHRYHLPRAFNIEPNMCWECYSCVKACPQLIPPRVMGSFTRTNALDPSGSRHNVTSSGEGKRQCQTIPLITTTTSMFMERT